MNLDLVETDALLKELMRRFDASAFVGQRKSAEDDLLERFEMAGQERVVQGLCTSLIIRCEDSIRRRMGPTTY